jgi:dTDP-glucose 4,6-dehydratase
VAKRALIAGGAGFLGSHLCDRLLVDGFEVACVDNLCTGRLENIKHLKGNKKFKFFKADVVKPLPVGASRGKYDLIFNLASPASPIDYQKLSIQTLLVGAYGTKNLLDLALQKKAVYVHASTSEVYGDPEIHPQVETYWGNVNPIGPRSMYDEAKRFAEALCVAYFRQKNLDVRLLRIFNTYGPRLRKDDGRVVCNFVGQALRGQPLTVYGDGSQTRSFCYVDDLIEGMMLIARAPKKVASGMVSGEAFNVGNPAEHSILEFAEKVRAMLNPRVQIIFKPLPTDDPKRRKPDITKMQKYFGWRPKVPLEDGLEKTAEYFAKA